MTAPCFHRQGNIAVRTLLLSITLAYNHVFMKYCLLLFKRPLSVLALLVLCVSPTSAQVLQKGMDAVLTTYSDGLAGRPVAMVKRIGDPIGMGAPLDVAANNWAAPSTTIPITNWTVSTMGQVFGAAIDNVGNVYFGATMIYYPVSSNYNCLSQASLTAATVSTNGFHGVGNSFGLIYKASATALNTVNCIVTASATTAGAGVGTTKLYNTGYGIGNLAVSNTYNKLYASNLEDGIIYCIDPATGNVDYAFDPLGADNGTAGLVPYGERVIAVAVNNEFDGTTRVYYSVLLSNVTGCQTVIRSVQLTTGGNFLPATDALEINLPLSDAVTVVPDIDFSVRGEMLVGEKGNAHNASVYQYYGHHNAWSVPQDMPVANVGAMNNANGGVDYGYMKTPSGFVCDSLIWVTENAMDNVMWYGIHSIPHNGFLPFVGNAFGSQAYMVDLDGIVGNNPIAQKGRFGDVEVYDTSCGTGPTDICGHVSLTAVKDTGSGCCYNLYASNKYHDGYFTALDIQTGHLNIDNVSAGNTWGGITYQSANKVSFGDTSHLLYMPKDSVGGPFLLARICVSGIGPDVLKAKWIGNEPQFDTVCEKQVAIDGCGIPVDTNCVAIFNQKAICENGVVKMQFQLTNNSSFTMRSVTIFGINPNVKPASSFFPIADVLPGSTSPLYTVNLVVKNGDTSGCFFFSACDINVYPGTSGVYPKFCCMDSIKYCVAIPPCDSCDAIRITAAKTDSSNARCCFKLTLLNNLVGSTVSCLRFNGIGGTQFAVFSGWNIQAPVSSSKITICAPGTGLGVGTYPEFANFCITSTSTAPYQVSVDFLDKNGRVICTKLLQFSDCEPVKPTCASIVNDSLYCDEGKVSYSFYIKNNSTFALHQVDLRLADTTFKLDKYLIIPTPPIAPGAMAGPYVVDIDSPRSGNKTFCMYLTGHNSVYAPDSLYATICCTDSLGGICLPFPDCDSACCVDCCEFDGMVIPTGITPNADGFNDMFVIQNSAVCTSIKITVFNRWGNIVYREENYKNTWTGLNTKGEQLPQGTYFVVIELDNGSKKATYIDIRY